MDKYEFNIKVEQIKKLMKKKDFITAVKIADTIDWERVRENQLLIMAADVYEIAGRYDDARDVLLLAYEKTGLGRQLAYRLCRLSVKRGDIGEAEEFYQEFTQNSPRDAGKYILQYEMAKGRGESIEKQIEILETYIEEDMDDRWAYELAKLYHKAHLRDKCVEQCDTIILWFADGKYVEKALELKQLYVPLSESQRLKYEAQKSRKAEAKKDIIQIVKGQEEEAAELEKSEETEDAEEQAVATDKPADGVEHGSMSVEQPAISVNSEDNHTYTEKQDGDVLDEVHEADIDVNSIHVKDFSVDNKYDTVNLQRELAQSMKSLFDNTVEIFKPNARKEEPAEEPVEDDQIEGQMSLEEVLAMFESGELQTRKESEETAEETAVEETVIEETAIEEESDIVSAEDSDVNNDINSDEDNNKDNDVIEDVIVENDIQEATMEVSGEVSFGAVEDMEIEELEDIEDEENLDDEQFADEEEVFEVEDLEPIEDTEMVDDVDENISDDMEDDGFGDNSSEEELLADIIAREIQIDISEEIDDEIAENTDDVEEMDEEEEEFEVAEEEYSEETESDIQESSPIMFDLKDDVTEDDNLDEVEEATELDNEDEESEFDEEESVYEEDIENDIEETASDEKQEEIGKPAPAVRASIQSEKAKEELKNFIARFSGVQGLDKQILKVMQTTLKVEKAPVKFILVKGEVKSGKTTLAIEVLKLANKIMQRRDQKIAKIKAESINGKSIDGLLKKLDGSDILIERVSDMEPDTFVEFIDKLNAEGRERFVIFEDEKSLADAFLEKVPESHREFANMLDIKQNRIKDWTKMASDYAKKQGYTFDEMGTLALSAKIDQLRAITLVVHKNHVEQLVDGAIKSYNKFSIGKLFRKFTEKNDDGLKVLTEKDFMD